DLTTHVRIFDSTWTFSTHQFHYKITHVYRVRGQILRNKQAIITGVKCVLLI
ncbi:hypothetical protein ACJX0J_038551, partial [Zea mays]